MTFLLDTCFISEFLKPVPDPGVVEWGSIQATRELYLSALTVGELEKGIARLPASERRERLSTWMEQELLPLYAGHILPIDTDVARLWGQLDGRCRSAGIALPVVDGLIAASAVRHGHTLVTRNTRDMAATGVPLHNPWTNG